MWTCYRSPFQFVDATTNTNLVWSDFTTRSVWKAAIKGSEREFMKDLYAVNECTVATQAGFVRGTALDVDNASLFCKSRGLTQALLQRVSSNIRAVILMEDGGIETLADVRERLVPTLLSTQLGERIATFLIDTFAVLRSNGWYHDGLTCGDIVVIRTTHEGVLSIKLCDYGTLSRHDEIRCKLLENINLTKRN